MRTPLHPWHIMSFSIPDAAPAGSWLPTVRHILGQRIHEPERLILVLSTPPASKTPYAYSTDLLGLMEQLEGTLKASGFPECRSVKDTDLIHVSHPTPELSIDWSRTEEAVHKSIGINNTGPLIIAGGLSTTEDGTLSFLLPGGGNFTATILANVLGAPKITLWGTHDGILSANPAYEPDAYPLPHLSFREAAELGYHVQPILHSKTLIPLQGLDVGIRIRSLDTPEEIGTYITRDRPEDHALAKAVTVQPDMALLVVAGLGLMGVLGVTAKALEALVSAQINVVLLSQAANEQSVGICVNIADKDRGLAALKSQFSAAIKRGDINSIDALGPVGIVSVVDDHMRYRTGLTGKMFSTLGRSGINVLTMAEGASETNISAVVAGDDLKAAVQALHEAFCYGRRRAHVFMFGVGTIGNQLLELMEKQSQAWLEQLNLNMCLVGVANSKKMIWRTSGIPPEEAHSMLETEGQVANIDTIIEHLTTSRLDRLIVIDATASNHVARCYPDLLKHNIAVVTPNKRANTLDIGFYNELQHAARDQQVPYFYETTVGAGLPIISTLRDLIRSGDEIIRIEGVLSGTLSYLFSEVANGLPLSEALENAYQSGYTEPDPRDDLSGEDVARKMLILAREMGLSLEREDIELSPILSKELFDLPKQEFLDSMNALLADWQPPLDVTDNGSSMHYIGTIENGSIRIGLKKVGESSHFATLSGTDNMVVFTTQRYLNQPLIVKGPGAGPKVTAGGVLADVIRAAELVT